MSSDAERIEDLIDRLTTALVDLKKGQHSQPPHEITRPHLPEPHLGRNEAHRTANVDETTTSPGSSSLPNSLGKEGAYRQAVLDAIQFLRVPDYKQVCPLELIAYMRDYCGIRRVDQELCLRIHGKERKLKRLMTMEHRDLSDLVGKFGHHATSYHSRSTDAIVVYPRTEELSFMNSVDSLSDGDKSQVVDQPSSIGYQMDIRGLCDGFIPSEFLMQITNLLSKGENKLDPRGHMLDIIRAFSGNGMFRVWRPFQTFQRDVCLNFTFMIKCWAPYTASLMRMKTFDALCQTDAIGVSCRRGGTRIRGPDKSSYFEERRVLVRLCTWKPQILGVSRLYSVLRMADENIVLPTDSAGWEESVPETFQRLEGTGICHFVMVIFFELDLWEKNWSATIAKLEESVEGLQLSHFHDQKKLDGFMFDESFQISRRYFTQIEMIRLAEKWIQESARDIKKLRAAFKSIRGATGVAKDFWEQLEAEPVVLETLDLLVASVDEKVDGLLQRTKPMSEELKSLRDGLFNATSLREATKGMALNKAIYVFTFVTVIYTPISFMATFWAQPLWEDSSNESSLPRGFTESWVVVPLLTYIIAVAIAWWVGSTRTTPGAGSGTNGQGDDIMFNLHELDVESGNDMGRLARIVRSAKELMAEKRQNLVTRGREGKENGMYRITKRGGNKREGDIPEV